MDGLTIGGVTPLSSLDFPDALAAVIYCQGCPWGCPYCHNEPLRKIGEEQRLPARARRVTIGLAGDAPIVQADAGKLHSVFSNLLANAIAYSPAGGRVRIELGLAAENVVIDCGDEVWGPSRAAA